MSYIYTSNLAIEAAMGIINVGLRKQVIRGKINSRIVDEAGKFLHTSNKSRIDKEDCKEGGAIQALSPISSTHVAKGNSRIDDIEVYSL